MESTQWKELERNLTENKGILAAELQVHIENIPRYQIPCFSRIQGITPDRL